MIAMKLTVETECVDTSTFQEDPIRGRAAVILVVEDGDLHRHLLKSLLTEEGHLAILCADGYEALDLLRSGLRPDLIITDVGLPGMSGLDLVGRLRATPTFAQVPVLVRSAAPRVADKARAAGADAFLDKGEETARLLATITLLLREGRGAGPRR